MTTLRALIRSPAVMRLFAVTMFFTAGALSLAICYGLNHIISAYFS